MEAVSNLYNFTHDLPEEILSAINSHCEPPRSYSDGEVIFNAGESTAHLFQVLSGTVELCHFSADGQEVKLTKYQADDWFGDINIMDGKPRLNTALALGDCRARALDRNSFLQLCEQYPAFLHAFSQKQTNLIRLLMSMMLDSSLLKLSGRILRILQRLLINEGKVDESGTRYIDCSQEELARYLAASRQSTHTELKKLEQSGMIRNDYGRIYVPDAEALNDTCNSLTSFETLAAAYMSNEE